MPRMRDEHDERLHVELDPHDDHDEHDERLHGCRNPPHHAPRAPLPPRCRIATWNCRTIFGSTQATPVQAKRVRATYRYLEKLLSISDITLLQETHGGDGDLHSLRQRFPDFLAFGCFCVVQRAAGLVFMVRKCFAEHYGSEAGVGVGVGCETIVGGRIAKLSFPATSGLQRLEIINVHLDPGLPGHDPRQIHTKRNMINSMFAAVAHRSTAHTIIAGDWNSIESDDPRLHPPDGRLIYEYSSTAKEIEAKLMGFTELHQPAFTRRQIVDGIIVNLSRIDRIYSNTATCELLDRRPQVSTVGLVTCVTSPSDHVPVLACLTYPRSCPPEFPTIPLWVAKHCAFPGAVDSMWSQVCSRSLGPMERLCLAKSILHSAAFVTKRIAAEAGNKTLAEKLHWTMLAFRGVRLGSEGVHLVSRAGRALHHLHAWLPGGPSHGDLHALGDLVADLARRRTDESIAEVRADAGQPGSRAKSRLSQLHVLAASWRSHRRRITLAVVVDDDGQQAVTGVGGPTCSTLGANFQREAH